MDKIKTIHKQRHAFIYVRQSTPGQVMHHRESQRLQYRLAERAKELGWQEDMIQVLDADLGKSASGGTDRKDFDKLLSSVCEKEIGAIFSIEASRLARNGREWHTLLELCGVVDTLIIDPEGIYDLNLSSDRLVLGLKGEMSEMEMRLLRERSHAALREKARRGELYLMIPAGYEKTNDDRLRKDPDKRVQKAIGLVFQQFHKLGSIRQTYYWFVRENVELPVVSYVGGNRQIQWKILSSNTIGNMLKNPVYGGAYAFGRTKRIIEIRDGHKHIRKGVAQDREDWSVLILEHHEGYITWQEYEAIQEIIMNNTNKKRPIVKGAVGYGDALLAGLLRCGHCGLKLFVKYQGREHSAHYRCRGRKEAGRSGCISFAGKRTDNIVTSAVLEVVSSVGLEVAILAIEKLEQDGSKVNRQRELALEQAQYEAQRAKRQYDAVEPENRLVAAQLESDWNEALANVVKLRKEIENRWLEIPSLSEKDKNEIRALAYDLPQAWEHPAGSVELRKRIIRTVIKEIVAYVDGQKVKFIVHWQGGDHTELHSLKNKPGETSFKTDVETKKIITQLSRIMPDKHTITFLNRLGKKTATGLTWTPNRVASFRKDHKISAFSDGERQERGELTVEEAADQLGIGKTKVLRLIQHKILPATQVCPRTPWIIPENVLLSENIRKAAHSKLSKRPSPDNSEQKSFNFQQHGV